MYLISIINSVLKSMKKGNTSRGNQSINEIRTFLRKILKPWITFPLLAVILVLLPLISSSVYFRHLLIMSLVYIILTAGLNLIVGYTGQLALGHAAFYGIGAYTFSILVTQVGVPYWIAFLCGGISAGLLAMVLGGVVLRLKGHYLAIVTLAFGEIVRVVLVNWVKVTRGPMGIMNIPPPKIFSFKFDGHLPYYYLALVLAGITIYTLWRLVNSRQGRGFIAIRDEEAAAIAMGLNTTWLKILAFTVGCFFAGLAGSFISGYIRFIHPDNFTVWTSLMLNAMVVIGGEGNIFGSIFGAVVLIVLPELLRVAQNFRMTIYAVFMVAAIILWPYGITGKPKNQMTDKYKFKKSKEIHHPETLGVTPGIPVNISITLPEIKSSLKTLHSQTQRKDILKVSDLTMSFGGLMALNSVNFDIQQSSIHAIIGPNGAGKSTVFNVLSGFYHPQSGSVLFDGNQLIRLKPNQICKLGLARTFQRIRLFGTMTALDNVLVACDGLMKSGTLDGILKTRRELEEEERMHYRALALLNFVGLEEKRNYLASNLPYGEQRRLEIARALATDVRVLLLDEPTAGMSGDETKDIINLIKQLKMDRELTIILIEHDMKVVMGISDIVSVLDHGVKIAEGTPGEIQSNDLVIQAYLGSEKGEFALC